MNDAHIIHLNPHDLRIGDIVLTHGMRCRVVEAPTISDGRNGGCAWTNTVVENRDDVPTGRVPMSYTPLDAEGRPRWSVQSNRLLTWAVERPCGECGANPCYGICPTQDPYGGDQARENADYEANARYDDIRERYAGESENL